MEQAQALLGLAVAGHLVLELAALLGEGAGAVVDPLVTVDLLALASAAAAEDEVVVAAITATTSSGGVLGVAGQDEGVLAVGILGDDVVDARLAKSQIKIHVNRKYYRVGLAHLNDILVRAAAMVGARRGLHLTRKKSQRLLSLYPPKKERE